MIGTEGNKGKRRRKDTKGVLCAGCPHPAHFVFILLPGVWQQAGTGYKGITIFFYTIGALLGLAKRAGNSQKGLQRKSLARKTLLFD